jgi:acyl carrier protein
MPVTEDKNATERNVRDFVISNFLFGVDDGSLKREDSFLQNGVLDSSGVLELVAFLEQSYKIKVNDHWGRLIHSIIHNYTLAICDRAHESKGGAFSYA